MTPAELITGIVTEEGVVRAPFETGLAEAVAARARRRGPSLRRRGGAGRIRRSWPRRGRLMATVAIGRRSAAIVARQTTDRAVLRDVPRAGPAVRRVRDLRPRGARVRADPLGRRATTATSSVAVGLEYSGPTPQPLFVMGRTDGIAAILRDVIRPRAAYVAARPDMLPAIETQYRVDPGPPMVRMWVDRARFRPYPATVQRLLPVEIGELNRLYQLGFASWLPSTAIADGVYYGMRVNGRWSPRPGPTSSAPAARLAVVGNVLTHVDYRGRGFATAVTGAVTAELLRTCDQVVLNVRADNPPAINAYRRLGYAEHVRFEERLIHRLGSPWADLAAPLRRLFTRKEIDRR